MRDTRDTIVVARGKAGKYYWRIKHANGKTLCHSQPYCSKSICKRIVLGLVSRHSGFRVEYEEDGA